MTIDPKSLWATLSPALRRQILDEVAAVLAEVSREVRTGQANPSGAQSGCLRPAVDAAPGGQQSRKPAAAVRASSARPRTRWHDADIDVIDADLGLSAASAAKRNGFKELVGRVGLSEIGLILSIDVTRLARNCSDWYPLSGYLRPARLPYCRSRWRL
ncbi:hypothetical protein [Mesorhizobium sp. M0633]|uniref:hypothetical protein n=1 Tax=Mesorhizobium sp. M0633 TaxID=2956977 RepID=UPI00333B5C53